MTQSYSNELQEKGYSVIPNLMNPELVKQANEGCETWLVDYAARKIGGGKVRGRYRKGLLSVTRMFDDLFTNSILLSVAGDLFGPHGFSFGGSSIKVVVPGEDARPMHQDDGIFPGRQHNNPCLLNVLIALDDFTEETGATHVVPESHKWGRPVEQDYPHISAEMKAGSVLLLHGRLWHQNGRNQTTDHERRALSFGYRTNRISKDMSPGRIEELPARLQEIM